MRRYNFPQLHAQVSAQKLDDILKHGSLAPSMMHIDMPDDYDIEANVSTLPIASAPPLLQMKPIEGTKEWGILTPLKLLANDGDKGLGDIIQRIIGDETSEAFIMWWSENMKSECGCKARRIWLNARYIL